MNPFRIWCAVLLGLPGVLWAQTPGMVLGSFPNTTPYWIRSQGQVQGGIVGDMASWVSKDLGIPFSTYFPPKNRTDYAADQGLVSVLPICNPAWVENPDKYHWSSALFLERYGFALAKTDKRKIKTLEDLQGLRIGMITGYRYPELKKVLEQKLFLRDDAATLFRNIQRLDRGWIDGIYDSEILLQYKAPGSHFRLEPLFLGKTAIHWAIPKASPLPYEKIFGSLNKMIQTGALDRIFAKYGLTRVKP